MDTYNNIAHICHNPMTGVWSVMKTLAQWQENIMPGSVQIIVICNQSWPHRDELSSLCAHTSVLYIPYLPHGYQFPYLFVTRIWNKINTIIRPGSIAHYHNSWLSSTMMESHVIRPSIVTTHGIPANGYLGQRFGRSALHQYFANRTARSGATMVSVDHDSALRFSQVFKTPQSNFQIISNGVIDYHLTGCPRLRGSELFTIGFIGTLETRKGWKIVCDAGEILSQAGMRIRLILAGDGSSEDQAIARRACTAIGNGSLYLGLVRNVCRDVIPMLDTLVLPSNSEGLPMAVLESLCAGVPIICTPVGGLPQLLCNHSDCIFIERNAHSVADAIRVLISNPSLHRNMSNQARSTYEKRGSVDQMAGSYMDLYRQIAKCWPHGSNIGASIRKNHDLTY
jgi:glycosyltransferase involved in cell wall biosynthesis